MTRTSFFSMGISFDRGQDVRGHSTLPDQTDAAATRRPAQVALNSFSSSARPASPSGSTSSPERTWKNAART